MKMPTIIRVFLTLIPLLGLPGWATAAVDIQIECGWLQDSCGGPGSDLNRRPDPGEEFHLPVLVRNVGDSEATNVVVEYGGSSELLPSGILGPSESAAVELTGSVPSSQICGQKFSDVVVRYDQGSVSAECGVASYTPQCCGPCAEDLRASPDLETSRVVFDSCVSGGPGHRDGFWSPGETGWVHFTLCNSNGGTGDWRLNNTTANQLRVEAYSDSPGATLEQEPTIIEMDPLCVDQCEGAPRYILVTLDETYPGGEPVRLALVTYWQDLLEPTGEGSRLYFWEYPTSATAPACAPIDPPQPESRLTLSRWNETGLSVDVDSDPFAGSINLLRGSLEFDHADPWTHEPMPGYCGLDGTVSFAIPGAIGDSQSYYYLIEQVTADGSYLGRADLDGDGARETDRPPPTTPCQ